MGVRSRDYQNFADGWINKVSYPWCFARMELRFYDSTGLTDDVNRFSVTPCVIINPSPSRINIRIDQDSHDKKLHVTSYEIHSYQVVLFTQAFAWLGSHCCKNIVSTLTALPKLA